MKAEDLARYYRQARPAGFGRNWAKTLAQTVVFWGFFLVLLPWFTADLERRLGVAGFAPRRWLGAAVSAAFGSLGLTTGFLMARHGRGTPLPVDAPRELVVVGPYGYVRNPMAIAGLAQGIGTALWFGSWLVIVYVLAGAVLWDRFIRPSEEADLVERFGAAFEQYRAEVSCWLPRRRRWSPGSG